MAKKERKARNEIPEDKVDLLKPLDVLSLGSKEDPCFGVLHDLASPECKSCGDADFCALVKAQGLHKERLKFESGKRFKDIEEGEQEIIKKKEEAAELIKKYKTPGHKRLKTILRVSKELGIPKDIVKQVYDQI